MHDEPRTVSDQNVARAAKIAPAVPAAWAVAPLVSPIVVKWRISGRKYVVRILQIVNRLAGQNSVVREVPAFEHDIRFHRLLAIPDH
jgi:hypothetical protein